MLESEMAAYLSTSTDINGSRSPSPSGVESTDSSLDTDKDEPMLGSVAADPSVVVGMACRVPGATNTSQLWKVLAEQQDLQKKMPEDRFNVDAYYHPQGMNKGTVCTYNSSCSSYDTHISRPMPSTGTSSTRDLTFLTMNFFVFPAKKLSLWILNSACY